MANELADVVAIWVEHDEYAGYWTVEAQEAQGRAEGREIICPRLLTYGDARLEAEAQQAYFRQLGCSVRIVELECDCEGCIKVEP